MDPALDLQIIKNSSFVIKVAELDHTLSHERIGARPGVLVSNSAPRKAAQPREYHINRNSLA
jgi:hypothetical protein